MIDILVPLEQEGTEAVVSAWLCKVGDRVAKDDPVAELETDKVSVEVPAPASGIVTEILIAERAAARPGMVMARLREEEAGEAAAPAAAPPAPSAPPEQKGSMAGWHSPAVRKALAETGLDPGTITGTGRDGRLTMLDIRKAEANRTAPPAAGETPAPAAGPRASPPVEQPAGRSVPHSPMRLAIARNMLNSVQTAPQVTAVFEADFSAVMAHRRKHRAAFEGQGIALSPTAYVVAAAARAMQAVPAVNSRWHEDRLEIFADIDIGIGTALGDAGLVVPVIRRVQALSLLGIAGRLQNLTQRAREGALRSEEMRGGTFTISNHGVSGSLLAAPVIINQPQSAILGVGKLEKRVVVREVDGHDTIQIRPMAYVTLTIDHRVLDGFQTNAWLTAFVETLESWPAD